MKSPAFRHSRWIGALAIIAILFGVLTIISGGRTLFNAEARQLAGNYVAFVLWFNFLTGFAYVIAGVGLWLWQRWSVWLAFAIAAATFFVFAAFGLQIWLGGSYEMRTVAAMALRSITWLAIAVVAYSKLANTQYRATV
jgi:hypothetical protein